MGIQIVSVLAESHSTLTSSSGVELQPYVDHHGREIELPNPNTEPAKYVEEVMLQWSAGHSRRPPTWRQLLTVLQDMDLIQLSQQIEEFIKGKIITWNINTLHKLLVSYIQDEHSCTNNYVVCWICCYFHKQLGMYFSFLSFCLPFVYSLF